VVKREMRTVGEGSGTVIVVTQRLPGQIFGLRYVKADIPVSKNVPTLLVKSWRSILNTMERVSPEERTQSHWPSNVIGKTAFFELTNRVGPGHVCTLVPCTRLNQSTEATVVFVK
jgi:hypothetical protein